MVAYYFSFRRANLSFHLLWCSISCNKSLHFFSSALVICAWVYTRMYAHETDREGKNAHTRTLVVDVRVSVRWVEPYSVLGFLHLSFLFLFSSSCRSFFHLLDEHANGHSWYIPRGQNGRYICLSWRPRSRRERKKSILFSCRRFFWQFCRPVASSSPFIWLVFILDHHLLLYISFLSMLVNWSPLILFFYIWQYTNTINQTIKTRKTIHALFVFHICSKQTVVFTLWSTELLVW